MKQTAMRAATIFFVKFIGLIGRVALTRLVGAEGVGLYQIAYSFYGLTLILITGGLPTALALSTAKNAAQGWLFFRIISFIILLIGAAVSLFAFHFSPLIAHILGNPQLDFAIRCLSPALLIVPLLSLLRGYLQGLEWYNAIAISELTEQFVRVAALVLLVIFFLPSGVARALGGGVLGTSAGALLAFLVLIVLLLFSRSQQQQKAYEPSATGQAFSLLLKTSFAIAVTRLLIPASDFIEALLVPKRLQAAGYSALEAMQMYGVLTGMAMILVYMPTILTAAVSHTLTMKIAVDWQEGRTDNFYRRTSAALEIGWLWGLISGLFLYLYAGELSWFIFGTHEAKLPIQYLSPVPLITGLREISISVLWAQNHKKLPFVSLASAILISFVLLYFLLAIPGFGYTGAAISLLLLELIAAVWNLRALKIIQAGYFRIRTLLLDIVIIVLIFVVVSVINALFENVTQPGLIVLLPGLLIFLGCTIIHIKIRSAALL